MGSEYWKKASIAGIAGFLLANSLAYGIDIGKEGIILIVTKGIINNFVGLIWDILFFILDLAFFICGLYLSYKEVKGLIEEDWQSIIISILSFISIFLIYLGMALNSKMQDFGAYLLVANILFLLFIKKE